LSVCDPEKIKIERSQPSAAPTGLLAIAFR
jgi:hypothetical protein